MKGAGAVVAIVALVCIFGLWGFVHKRLEQKGVQNSGIVAMLIVLGILTVIVWLRTEMRMASWNT
jgi:hypothetical protein